MAKTEKSAYEVGLDTLSRAPKSVQELKDHLYKKGFHRQEVDEAIEKLVYYNFLNDENYVRMYLDYYGDKYGKKLILYKLLNDKRIDGLLAETAIEDRFTDEIELEKALKLSAKYLKHKPDEKAWLKLGPWLYSKGFEWNVINRAVDFAKKQNNEGE